MILVIAAALLTAPVAAGDNQTDGCGWIIKCNINGKVTLDGESVGQFKDHTLKIPYNGHPQAELEIKASGYSTYTDELEQPWDKQWLTIYVVMERIDGNAGSTGSVRITSDPPGARVWYQEDYLRNGDYKDIGVTPLTVYFSESGWHRVILYSEGYGVVEKRILVTADDMIDWHFNLVPGNSTEPFKATPAPTEKKSITPKTVSVTPFKTVSIAPSTAPTEIQEFNIGSIFGVIIMLMMMIGGAVLFFLTG